MAKKVLILCGSPRPKGNTNTLAGWFAQGAADAGAEVETIDAAQLEHKVNGCTCCMACQKSDAFECVYDDEVSAALRTAADADVLVFATPIYCFGPTAQIKLLLDRNYCAFKFDQDTGAFEYGWKKAPIVLLATGAGPYEEGLDLTEAMFSKLANFIGVPFEAMTIPHAPKDPTDLASNDHLRKQAVELGQRIATA
jgi:multimeric flavodoxin WrbA